MIQRNTALHRGQKTFIVPMKTLPKGKDGYCATKSCVIPDIVHVGPVSVKRRKAVHQKVLECINVQIYFSLCNVCAITTSYVFDTCTIMNRGINA